MNSSLKILASVISASVLLSAGLMAVSETPEKEARVTKIIRDVKILPTEADARPAVMDDKVQEGTAVRTGDESRSELTFVDLTITRLGANTVYSFDKAGRNIRLESGTILVRVPKDSGGAQIKTSAVTVGITGTTGVVAFTPEGQSSLIILEGEARMSLNKYPGKSTRVRAGKRIDVEANATKIPPPTDVDLEQFMQTSPLITDFPPLPSQDLILAAIRNQNSHTHKKSRPSSGGSTQAGPVIYPSQPVNRGGQPPPTYWPTGPGKVGNPDQPYPTPTPKRPKRPPKYPPGNVTNPDQPYPTPTPWRPKRPPKYPPGNVANPNEPYPTPTPGPKRPPKRPPKYPVGRPTPTPPAIY